jgi:hypothetical protein
MMGRLRHWEQRVAVVVAAVAVVVLLLGALSVGRADGAPGVFSLDRLRLGGPAGAEDYVFTKNDVVYPDGGVDAGAYYRVVVRDASNVVRNGSFPCTPASAFATTDNAYTIKATDPTSTALTWKFTLEQYAGA